MQADEIELPNDFTCVDCGIGFPDDGCVDKKEPRCLGCYARYINCSITLVEKNYNHKPIPN